MTENGRVIATINERLNGHGEVIVEEAQGSGLDLALACAMVDQESDGRNIFGGDLGPVGDRPPYYRHEVTRERVQKLIKSPHMNGVGLTQLTWFTFVNEAEAMGGAHLPRFQCRVGFRLLKEYLDKYPYLEALGAYNAGEANRHSVLETYAKELAASRRAWDALLGEGVAADGNGDETNFDRGIVYLTPAIDNAPYWFWPPALDVVPDGPGAYAVNLPPPDINQVINEGLFCAAVVNLIRRVSRKTIPKAPEQSFVHDGGTLAVQRFWEEFIEPFDRWAVYPQGTLIGRYFSWARVEQGDQGHVAVLLDEQNLAEQKDPNILHSHPAVEGLARSRLGLSHSGWYYEYAIRPENWINHGVGGF